MDDRISRPMSICVDSPSDKILNRGPLVLLLRRQYEFPFRMEILLFLSVPSCGAIRSQGPSNRVIGGSTADEHQFPWVTMLLENGNHKCGGSILDEYHILTAAHCLSQ